MSHDPTTTSAHSSQPAAGWYPDPTGEPLQRWWDGSGWTAQTYDPAGISAQVAPAQVAQGTPVYTLWIWLIVGLQLIGLVSLFFVDHEALFRSSLQDSLTQDPEAIANPFAGMGDLFTPAELAQTVVGWLAYLVGVGFAFLDWRTLKQRGFDRPFHWAWAFVPWSLVYVIGRSVVVKRRAGFGLAPIWWYIGITVLVTVVSLIVIGGAISAVLPEVMPSVTTAP